MQSAEDAMHQPPFTVYGHPFASFCWKVFIAMYEREVPFSFEMVDPDHPHNAEAIARMNPNGQFPALVHGDRVIIESAAIIEYLDLHHAADTRMVPADPHLAIEARQMDAVFDDYVSAPLTRMVLDALRSEEHKDPIGVEESKSKLDRSYAWLDRWMQGRRWAANDCFGIADCSGAPALFYAHWVHPIPPRFEHLRTYRARLLERPTIARVVDEARPFRKNFPLDHHSPD